MPASTGSSPVPRQAVARAVEQPVLLQNAGQVCDRIFQHKHFLFQGGDAGGAGGAPGR
jgi:hypothetical protein